MGCISASCSPPNTGVSYQTATGTAAQRIPGVDDSVLMQYAAQNGASSSNFTMCLTMACLIARRLIYYKCTPGDCGAPGTNFGGGALPAIQAATAGLGTAASVDPEPISKGILAGVAAIMGGFTAAHAAAVANEQSTICEVAVNTNRYLQALEQAVKGGQLTADSAASVVNQLATQFDVILQAITKSCNAACGFRIALRALAAYENDIVFPALVPVVNIPIITPVLTSLTNPPVGSPGAAGTTYQTGVGYPTPPNFPSIPTTYQGASGPINIPMNANNPGIPPAVYAAPTLPFSLTPGSVLVIGGVAYVASRL